jgi:hypothetical protein
MKNTPFERFRPASAAFTPQIGRDARCKRGQGAAWPPMRQVRGPAGTALSLRSVFTFHCTALKIRESYRYLQRSFGCCAFCAWNESIMWRSFPYVHTCHSLSKAIIWTWIQFGVRYNTIRLYWTRSNVILVHIGQSWTVLYTKLKFNILHCKILAYYGKLH